MPLFVSSVRTIAPKLALMFLLWSGSASATDLVSTHLYGGDVKAALEAARSDASAHPDDMDAQELYIDLLLASGQAARALSEARDAVKVRPADPSAHYLVGRATVDAPGATAAYERALRLDPDHARSHMGMGAVHTATGDFAEAEAAYSEALKRDGTLGEAWLGLVRLKILTGAPHERALDLARRGMIAAPDEGGLVLSAAGLDPKNARKILEGAAKTSGDARVHTRLAELLLASGNADGATVSARHALSIDPGEMDAARVLEFGLEIVAGSLDLQALAAVLDARDQMRDQPAAAGAALDTLAESHPRSALIFLARAEAWDKAGERAKAFESLALALQRNPNLVDAQAAFGLALVREERHKEAVPWLIKAVNARPWDPDLLRGLGSAQRHSGDVEAAVETLRTANRARPWEIPTLLTYAEALQASGESEAAYGVIRDGLRKTADPSLAVAFVVAAQAAGHGAAAADFLEDLGRKSGSAKLIELAQQIRQKAG